MVLVSRLEAIPSFQHLKTKTEEFPLAAKDDELLD
jgi:hypothetical protein